MIVSTIPALFEKWDWKFSIFMTEKIIKQKGFYGLSGEL